MKRIYIEITIYVLIIAKVILIGITSTCSAFCEFYKYEEPDIIKMLSPRRGYENTLTSYLGFDTGYGFFAPNVSSNFIILSTDKKENKTYYSSDLLETTEGKLRFLSVNDIFLKNIANDKEKIKVNHIVLKQINKYFEKKYNSEFETFVYLYDYPSLKDLKKNKDENLIKVDSVK